MIRVEADPRNPDKARDGSKVVLLGANGTPDHMGDLDRGDRPPYSCMADGEPVADCLPVDGPSHTVDDLVFGPDGALYVSAGDGTLQPDLNVRAQNVDSLAGKILRINPLTGAGYADNPFYDGDPNSNRSKVYALGLRNPYRFTFDPAGQLVVGDVGGERWEEINRGDPGANFGWPCLEGPLPNSGDPACAAVLSGAAPTTAAWHSYAHADGYSAAIGGDFYTGDKYPAAYQGAYFFADHNHAALLYLPAGAGGDDQAQEFATNVIAPVQISMGPDGSLYVLSFVDGTLSRIRYTGDGSEPAPVPTPAATDDPSAADTCQQSHSPHSCAGGREQVGRKRSCRAARRGDRHRRQSHRRRRSAVDGHAPPQRPHPPRLLPRRRRAPDLRFRAARPQHLLRTLPHRHRCRGALRQHVCQHLPGQGW